MDQWSDDEIILRQNFYDEIYSTIDKVDETINNADTLQKLTDEYSRKREITGYINALEDNNLPVPDDILKELQTYHTINPPREIIEKD